MDCENYLRQLTQQCKNYVLLGEAGSGKSEIALNLALRMRSVQSRPVHFFDLDMTKPLFRSRDFAETISKEGIAFHFEQQFMDAPTLVGGVNRLLRDTDSCVVMDVGGAEIGARAVGGYAPWLNKKDTAVFYVVNSYRPWSHNIDNIDGTLAKILGVSHIRLENLHFICNPNNGCTTTEEEFISGYEKTAEMLSPYCKVELVTVREALYPTVRRSVEAPVMPLRLFLTYPWLQEADGPCG